MRSGASLTHGHRSRLAVVIAGAALAAAGTTAVGAGGAVPGVAGPSVSPALRAPAAVSRTLGGCRAGTKWGVPRPGLAHRVAQLVNEHRVRLGLWRLKGAKPLRRSASWKARHMARFNYMGHHDPAPPVERSPAARLAACGFAGAALGENIASGYTSPESVVAAWLASPGHRANIESMNWTHAGVGVAQARNGRLFWAQNFGADPAQPFSSVSG